MTIIVCTTLQQVHNLINEVEKATHTKYIQYGTNSSYTKDDWQPSENIEVFFERKKSGNTGKAATIPFNGTPYTLIGSRSMICHQGKDLQKAAKKKNAERKNNPSGDHEHTKRRLLIQDSKKVDCPAVLNITRVAAFTDEKFQIKENTKHKRYVSSSLIRNYLGKKNNVQWEDRYFVVFPQLEDHQGHPTIGEVLRENETEQALAIKYITNTAPESEDATHHAAGTEMKTKPKPKSILDKYITVELKNLIDRWRKRDPQDNFYLRIPQLNQKILIVYQTSFQRHLLHRYGQEVCLLDSTHKSRFDSSPFFLVVRTNFCYVVVATFVLQHETTQAISEALEIIKNWNKDWSPTNFIVDLDKAQINAVENVFRGCQAVLCDFYCDRAWRQWTNSVAHNIQYKNQVLKMLRQIAHSDTKAKYEQALKTLEESGEWSRNFHLQNWFITTWKTEVQRWVEFHYDESLHRNIRTIKGMESINGYFKNNYFENYKESAISDMMTILVDKVFPAQQLKYFELNVKSSSGYRRYNNKVPKFLHNRPREIVAYILKRYNSPECDQVIMISQTSFNVKCATDKKNTYEVSMGTESTYESCNCPDWKRKRLPCKHFCAIIKRGWDWENLCHKFSDNPLFQLDSFCFSGNLESQPIENITVEVDNNLILDEEEEEEIDSSMNLNEEEENEDIILHDIPARKRKIDSQSRNKCIAITKTIQDRLYLIQDEEYLETLYAKMGEILNEIGSHVPNEEGITIPYPAKKRKKQKHPTPKEKRMIIQIPSKKKKNQKQDNPTINPEQLPNPYLPPCPFTSHSSTSYSPPNLNLATPFASTMDQLYPSQLKHSTNSQHNTEVFNPNSHFNPSSYW